MGWRAALSIMTAVPKSGGQRPCTDDEGPDGLHRYELRRDQRGTAENEGLRVAMHDQLPLNGVATAPTACTASAADARVLARP